MKQISRVKLFLSAVLLTSSFLASFAAIAPQNVFAAGCQANPATDSQATNQENCRQKYIEQCEKDFPRKKSTCQNISVADINRCTGDGSNNKLKADCFNRIEAPADEDDSSAASSSDYNENDCASGSFDQLDGNNCGILKYILLITNVLSGIAGTVIVAMIIVGGIQYATAGPDPSKIQAAKLKITNALLALLLFIFGFAILQYFVPGGIL